MENCKYGSLIFVLLFLFMPKTLAQNKDDGISSANIDDYSNIILPPLSVLFENARQAPTYQLAEVEEQLQHSLLSKEKRAFLNFFSIRGSYQYGMFGTEANYSDASTPVINNYSSGSQISYSIGAAVSLPIEEILDLKGRVKRQRLNLITSQLQKEMAYEAIKQNIIQLYNTINTQLSLLKVTSEQVLLSDSQYEIQEKNFTNGLVTPEQLTEAKKNQANAKTTFESTKNQLTTSIMILEIISHTKILNNKNSK